MVISKTLATLCANRNEGLYFPFSKNTMVSLLTPTRSASVSWVMSLRARNSLIRVCMQSLPTSVPVQIDVADEERYHHDHKAQS